MSERVYVYTQGFDQGWRGPFWDMFFQILAHNGAKDCLFLVPSHAFKQSLVSECLRRLDHDICLPDLLTFDELIAACFYEQVDAHVLTEQGCLSACMQDNPLLWPSSLQSPASLKALQALWQDTRRYGWSATTYKRCESHPFHEAIPRLFLEAQQRLKSYPTKPLLSLYYRAEKEGYCSLLEFVGSRSVFCAGFWQLPPYQQAVLDALWTLPGEHSLLLYYIAGHSAYQAAVPWIRRLEADSRIEWLSAESPSYRKTPSLFVADHVQQEVAHLISWILSALQSQTIKCLEDVSIVLADYTRYLPVLAQEAQAKSLPLYLSTRYLEQRPLGRLIQAILTLSYPLQDLQAFLGLFSQSLFHSFQGIIPLPWLWELADSIGRKPRYWLDWERAFHTVRNKCPEIEQSALDSQLALLDALNKQCQRFFYARSMHEIITAFVTLWKAIDLDTFVSTFSERDCDLFRADTEAFDALLLSLEIQESQRILMIDGPESWQSRLRLGLSQQTVSSPHKNGLRIVGKFDAFLINTPVIWILGCEQGTWPQAPRPSVFISSQTRKRLGWPSVADQALADRYIWESLYQHPDAEVMLSVSRSQNDHRLSLCDWILPDTQRQVQTCVSRETSFVLAEKPVPLSEKLISMKSTLSLSSSDTLSKTDTTHSVYSPSMLESYQRCPRAFYLRRVLKVPDSSPSQLDIADKDWGDLLHAVMKEFVSSWPYTSLSKAENTLSTLFKDYAQRLFPDDHWLHFRCERWKKGHAYLKSWISLLRELFVNYKPIGLEVPLGPFTQESETDSFSVSGQADLLIQHREKPFVFVVDYKTGSMLSSPADLRQGKSLQLPLYLLALQHHPGLVLNGTNLLPSDVHIGGAILLQCHRELLTHKTLVLSPDCKEDTPLSAPGPRSYLTWDDHSKLDTISILDDIHHDLSENMYSEDPVHGRSNATSNPTFRQQSCSFCSFQWSCQYPERWKGALGG
ncbi:MAG: PD-(D/E)XK nuclease family protein [bacterium]